MQCLLPSFAAYVSHARAVGFEATLTDLRQSFDRQANRAYNRGEQARHRSLALEAGEKLASMPPESVPSAPVGRRVEYAPPVRLATPKKQEGDPGSVPLIE